MKKLLLTISLVSLMLTAILSGCAGSGSGAEGTTAATDKTAASDVSIDQLISSNDLDSLMKKYDNVMLRGSSPYHPGHDVMIFTTKDYVYILYEGNEGEEEIVSSLYDDKNTFNTIIKDGKPVFSYDWYAGADTDDEKMNPYSDNAGIISAVKTAKEKITDVKDHGDGTMTISTSIDQDTYAQIMKEDAEETGEKVDERLKNCSFQSAYEVDAGTLEINSYTETILDEKGNTVQTIHNEVSKNIDQPQGFDEMVSQADELLNKTPQDPKTITVIYDAGSDKEETFSITTDKKFLVYVFGKDGYQFYDDPDKKELSKASDGKSDRTMYAFKAE